MRFARHPRARSRPFPRRPAIACGVSFAARAVPDRGDAPELDAPFPPALPEALEPDPHAHEPRCHSPSPRPPGGG